eukprot:scaffold72709_cov19-Tisochrysis_lutea.AAC.1
MSPCLLKRLEIMLGAVGPVAIIDYARCSRASCNNAKYRKASVERVMGVTTSMYVRRTLPLQQAISAMKQKDTKAAVVVDDNFKVNFMFPYKKRRAQQSIWPAFVPQEGRWEQQKAF